jgi:uncharacterized protein YuzE
VFVDVQADGRTAETATAYRPGRFLQCGSSEPCKVTYAVRSDSLAVTLRTDVPVAESDESRPGVILDYDADGNPISLEILDASQRVTEADKVEFQVAS